jgi:hypothetical protein
VRAINNQTVALFSDYTVWRGLEGVEGEKWGEKRGIVLLFTCKDI